jgi:hypothetical protein
MASIRDWATPSAAVVWKVPTSQSSTPVCVRLACAGRKPVPVGSWLCGSCYSTATGRWWAGSEWSASPPEHEHRSCLHLTECTILQRCGVDFLSPSPQTCAAVSRRRGWTRWPLSVLSTNRSARRRTSRSPTATGSLNSTQTVPKRSGRSITQQDSISGPCCREPSPRSTSFSRLVSRSELGCPPEQRSRVLKLEKAIRANLDLTEAYNGLPARDPHSR